MTTPWFYMWLILFFFMIWLYSGGPAHPISFAGPYITPVTDVGVSSNGYGGQVTTGTVGSYFSNWAGNGSGSGSTNRNVLPEAQSPYAGTVHFGSNYPQGTHNFDEYLNITNDGTTYVTVSGWQVVDAVNKNSIRIQDGYRNLDGGSLPVILAKGQSATIYTGSRYTADTSNNYNGAWYIFLSQNHDLWNNNNDTLTLLDADGKVVDQYRY